MPFLNRRTASLSARRDAEKTYRSQLRAALGAPDLSVEQKREIRRKLEQVGKPRVYDAQSPPPPGAIELPATAPEFTEVQLRGKKKAVLQKLAGDRGLLVSGTKTALVERLLLQD